MKLAAREGQDEGDTDKAEGIWSKEHVFEPEASGPAAPPGEGFSVQPLPPLWMINEWPLNTVQRLCTSTRPQVLLC